MILGFLRLLSSIGLFGLIPSVVLILREKGESFILWWFLGGTLLNLTHFLSVNDFFYSLG